ncbi:hypothetical protein ES708_27664 [subsurface metagenome]
MREYIDEIIALILVVGCLLLIGFGIDGEVKSILTMAAGWVFGREYIKRVVDRKKSTKGGK